MQSMVRALISRIDDLPPLDSLSQKGEAAMHIVLGILGPIITVLILLNRLAEAGIDLGGLNPFLWQRRRKWRNQYTGNPLFQIESPMDAAGILLVSTAKADGDISLEEKKALQAMFEKEFNLSSKDAAGLFISSVHLIGDGVQLRAEVERFLKPNKEQFSQAQIALTLRLLNEVAAVGGSAHPNTTQFLASVAKELQAGNGKSREWG